MAEPLYMPLIFGSFFIIQLLGFFVLIKLIKILMSAPITQGFSYIEGQRSLLESFLKVIKNWRYIILLFFIGFLYGSCKYSLIWYISYYVWQGLNRQSAESLYIDSFMHFLGNTFITCIICLVINK